MPGNPLELLVRKLRSRGSIDSEAEAAILKLPYTERSYEPPSYLIREGSTGINHCGMILSGFAFRQKLTSDGSRQILSMHMRGDLMDLQHLFLNRADHNVQALTRLEMINIDRTALQGVALEHRSIGEALWTDTLIEASVYREWIVNVGRRDARTRVAHLLCEFAVRMKSAGLGDGQSYDLPMTQEQIGDAVGLTSVHVNRTLKMLEQEGFIQRDKRKITFTGETMRRIADFTTLYLHLDQTDDEVRES